MITEINRPWISSFSFAQAPFGDAKMEQVHKLTRNFVASLDLGCPHVRHVRNYAGMSKDMDQRGYYKLWVTNWKTVYREVSGIIRLMKQFRKTTKFPKLSEAQLRIFKMLNPGVNEFHADTLRQLAFRHLPRLKETAQVLLNARYNAKLAAAEARRRALAKEG